MALKAANIHFPTYFIPPNRLSRHFRATTGVCDVARFQKTAKKWNRATFTECRTCRNRRNHVTMARKTHSKLRFSCILMLRVSPIGNRNRESRKCRRLDRNDSYPDIEGDTSRRLPHVNRKHQGNAPDCMMLFRIAVYFQKNEDGMVRFALLLADVLIDVTVQHDYARNF